MVVLAACCVDATRSIERRGKAAFHVAHPHPDDVVGEEAMHVSTAAGGCVARVRLVGHHLVPMVHGIVIGGLRCKELVWAGEILHSLPVLLDSTKTPVEAGAFHAVAPQALTCGHQHVAP